MQNTQETFYISINEENNHIFELGKQQPCYI